MLTSQKWQVIFHHKKCCIQVEDDENDNPELVERLARQRKRAIQAARAGRKTNTSRNAYKDKGGKSSNNSKLQKQMTSW